MSSGVLLPALPSSLLHSRHHELFRSEAVGQVWPYNKCGRSPATSDSRYSRRCLQAPSLALQDKEPYGSVACAPLTKKGVNQALGHGLKLVTGVFSGVWPRGTHLSWDPSRQVTIAE